MEYLQRIVALDAIQRQYYRRRIIKQRRLLRDASDPLAVSDAMFVANYRLTKEVFLRLVEELRPIMQRIRNNSGIPNEIKILCALSFFANGSYQRLVGENFNLALSQKSVSRCLKEVTQALNNPNIQSLYIKFPNNANERLAVIRGFYDAFKFPSILGCIDCTHVRIIKPKDNEEWFLNRKGYHSRNVQIICDKNLKILHADSTYGGSTHDSFVWNRSEIKEHLEMLSRTNNIWFLGDSGYAQRKNLMTPIIDAVPNSPEEYYTTLHCKVRNTVERCIGVLKARWRCLLVHRALNYDPNMASQIINACCVLHNICTDSRLPVVHLTPEEYRQEQRRQMPAVHIDPLPPRQRGVRTPVEVLEGFHFRSQLVQNLWLSHQIALARNENL